MSSLKDVIEPEENEQAAEGTDLDVFFKMLAETKDFEIDYKNEKFLAFKKKPEELKSNIIAMVYLISKDEIVILCKINGLFTVVVQTILSSKIWESPECLIEYIDMLYEPSMTSLNGVQRETNDILEDQIFILHELSKISLNETVENRRKLVYLCKEALYTSLNPGMAKEPIKIEEHASSKNVGKTGDVKVSDLIRNSDNTLENVLAIGVGGVGVTCVHYFCPLLLLRLKSKDIILKFKGTVEHSELNDFDLRSIGLVDAKKVFDTAAINISLICDLDKLVVVDEINKKEGLNFITVNDGLKFNNDVFKYAEYNEGQLTHELADLCAELGFNADSLLANKSFKDILKGLMYFSMAVFYDQTQRKGKTLPPRILPDYEKAYKRSGIKLESRYLPK